MRILCVSGSIGLGHASRDLAIARELRRMHLSVEIDWLAGERRAAFCGRPARRCSATPRRTRTRLVHGGGTTTLELTALRRPFLYFPLEGHCEQEVAVASRLARHGAGERLSFGHTTPEVLAERVAALVGTEPDYPPIGLGGASRVAEAALRLVDDAALP